MPALGAEGGGARLCAEGTSVSSRKDCDVRLVGLASRSYYRVLLESGFNTLVAEVFEEDVRQSANVSLETSRKEAGWRVAVESAANLLIPLL
jgi:hypothetical protein